MTVSLRVDGAGVRVDAAELSLASVAPVRVTVRSTDGSLEELSAPYAEVGERVDGFECRARVRLAAWAHLEVRDVWTRVASGVRVERSTRVLGHVDGGGFATSILLEPSRGDGWADVEVFIPGVAYGNAPLVADDAIGGLPARRAGIRDCFVREDRTAAPLFAVRYSDGAWLSVLDIRPDGGTVVADGVPEHGDETLVDAGLRYLGLGGTALPTGLALGANCPGSEGEITYSSGGLPLTQHRAWRRRFSPVADGFEQHYRLEIAVGSSTGTGDFVEQVWRRAWTVLGPGVTSAPIDQVMEESLAVLAGQAVTVGKLTGVPLEADAVDETASGLDTSAVMGFVGANTDAGYLLLREPAYRAVGERILDSFTSLSMTPPVGEGFDTVSGKTTTYRRFLDENAVYARSLAEGALAVLRAEAWEREHGTERAGWLAWARSVGNWLVAQQASDGSLPRAWVAGTGAVLDASRSAAYVVVPFLCALAERTGAAEYAVAAGAAAEFSWGLAGPTASYAGATLDNPDVVDKEAAILSAEAYLAMLDQTGSPIWLNRARAAAGIAETWIYLWNVPMPVDAVDAELHWKRDVPTIGHQLIASGVSMTDGFLASNASVFARLWTETGDGHWLDVARLVVHGTTAMTAIGHRTFDLRGPGWQQEHWSFSPRRGFGLNRRWLPWVPVAHVSGIIRVRQLGETVASAVLE